MSFFVLFFTLSMLTLCLSADQGSRKFRCYRFIFRSPRADAFLRKINTHSAFSYLVFVFGIVIASYAVLRELTTHVVEV